MTSLASRIAAISLMAILVACSRDFHDAESFLSEYRKKTAEATLRQGIRLETYYASPEFMAASRFRSDSQVTVEELDSVAVSYGNSLHFFLILGAEADRKAAMPGDPALSPTLAAGAASFGERLNHLQNELLRSCYLELPGGDKVYPSAYSYERNWGMDQNSRFLFVFPASWNGKPVPVFDSHIVVSEFGLSIGDVRHSISKAPSLKLKV